MQRPIVCMFGLFIAFLAICLRLILRDLYHYDGGGGGANADFQAWVDIIDISILAAWAMSAIGWLVPPRGN